jgi:hypothetical protein
MNDDVFSAVHLPRSTFRLRVDTIRTLVYSRQTSRLPRRDHPPLATASMEAHRLIEQFVNH